MHPRSCVASQHEPCSLAFCDSQIGGVRAPTPVGDLGNVEMTQALQLLETRWEPVGPDMLLTGYLPASGGLHALHAELIGGSQAAAGESAPSFAAAAPSSSRSNSSTPAPAPSAVHSANGAASPAAYAVPLLRPSRRRTSSPQVRRGADWVRSMTVRSERTKSLLVLPGAVLCCFAELFAVHAD